MPRRLICVLGLMASFLQAKEPFIPNLGPNLPTITVTCGDVTLLLRQETQWTPGRIDFRRHPMTTERSAYGTVFSFPDCGFIGTGHLENEPENLQSLAFWIGDRKVETPTARLNGNSFRFERRSRIRTFDLTNIIEIKNSRLYETATVHANEATPLKLVYHFMHAWTPTVSAFMAGKDTEPENVLTESLRDDPDVARKFYINDAVDWVAVFEPMSGQFAVSRLLEAPEHGDQSSKIWNVPPTYRKFYLTSFQNQTVPKGFDGTWRMVTAFGSSNAETWQPAAHELAQDLMNP